MPQARVDDRAGSDLRGVADDDITVEKYLGNVGKEIGAPVTVRRFVRMQLGA